MAEGNAVSRFPGKRHLEEGLHNDGDGFYRPCIEGVLTQFLSIGDQIINYGRIS